MSVGAQRKILLVTKKDLLIDVVTVFLEGLMPCAIEVADSSRKVEKLFESGSSKIVDFVFVEDEKILTAAGKKVGDFMVPAIVVSNDGERSDGAGRRMIYLKNPIDLNRLAQAFQTIAGASGAPKREYCPVRMEILLLFGKSLSCDVFRKDTSGAYSKVYGPGDSITMDANTAKLLGPENCFFLKFDDFAGFMRKMAEQMQTLSSQPEATFDLGNSVEATAGFHELLTNAVPELGFSSELQEATKASIDLAVKSLQSNPRLSDLLKALTELDSAYLSWHSTTLCYMACRLSSLMTWDSANTHFKLSLAAYLHDVTVKTPALERVRTVEELNAMKVKGEVKEEFREHPHVAAGLAREMSDFPGDVDHIIAQHHELPNGKGFPLGITHTKISPLASLFIIAHDLTDELYDKKKKFSLKDSVGRLEKTYTQGYFRRVIAALKEQVSKEGAAS
ncbi:MAG TPA: HD domain-containing phosphohydrolase [Bdellovibrionota bacterium]|jgi:hypothetical protein